MTMSEKYPAAGCKPHYFVDTNSFRVARGRIALFYGLVREDGTPDRTMSAWLIGAADSVEDLKQRHPEAFDG